MKKILRDYFIIIPAFNEDSVLGQVLEELLAYGYKNIIVVDDGSTDRTMSVAKSKGVYALRHKINRGKGAAIKTGIEAAKMLGAYIIVTFDGDGQHDPKDIEKIITYLHKGYDVVLGSRFLKYQQMPYYKRLFNYMANFIPFFLYGIWVTDSQSGLRGYGKRAFAFLDTRSDRYGFDTEVLRTIYVKQLSYKEIPIHVRYTRYSQEKQNRQDVVSAIQTIAKVIFSS